MDCDYGRDKGLNFLVGVISNRSGKLTFGLAGRPLPPPPPLQFPLLMGHPDLPKRKTLRSLLGLLTVMTVKRVSENSFFQSNKFTACKVQDEKGVANSLMAIILWKIINPFQGKKHLRT